MEAIQPLGYDCSIAKVISISAATSPATVAVAFPFPIGPLRRTIATSKRN